VQSGLANRLPTGAHVFIIQPDFYSQAARHSRSCLLVEITMAAKNREARKIENLDRDDSVLDGVLYQIGVGL
jgi:hypothetical protein